MILSSIWAPAKLALDLYREKREKKEHVKSELLKIKRSLKNTLLVHQLDAHLISLRELFLQNPSLYDARGIPEFYHKWIKPREEMLTTIAYVLTMEGAHGANAGYWTEKKRLAMLADLEKIKF
jgi:hypothetical protein